MKICATFSRSQVPSLTSFFALWRATWKEYAWRNEVSIYFRRCTYPIYIVRNFSTYLGPCHAPLQLLVSRLVMAISFECVENNDSRLDWQNVAPKLTEPVRFSRKNSFTVLADSMSVTEVSSRDDWNVSIMKNAIQVRCWPQNF